MYRAFWYDTIVIGVKVSWLSLNYSTFKIENKLQYQVIQANLFKVGPYFTRGLSDEMAIDIFAQIAPVYMYNLKDATENHGYAGFTYSLGFELRYEGATIGTDYNIGRASLIDKHAGLFFTKPQISYFRIFLGYKF